MLVLRSTIIMSGPLTGIDHNDHLNKRVSKGKERKTKREG